MKITKEDFKKIQDGCNKILAKNPDAAARYQAAGLSEMRFRWDVVRAAGLIPFFCDVIYKYADDTHINTALKKAIPVKFQ